MTEDEHTIWHDKPVEQVFKQLETSSDGLCGNEARQRIKQFGPNVVQKKPAETPLKILWRQLQNPLIYVLVASTVLTLVMGKVTDGIVVLSVIVINTVIGFVQEFQADRTIRGLMQMEPESVVVVRDGIQKNLPATELVPGDYVLLQAGDKIPADLRLTDVKNLRCDEAVLTGESLPVTKQTEPAEREAVPGDRTCVAFSGTLVTSGTGEGIVVFTGINTEIVKISSLLQTTISLKTPLTRSIEKLANWITISIALVCIAVFIIGLNRDYLLAEAVFQPSHWQLLLYLKGCLLLL